MPIPCAGLDLTENNLPWELSRKAFTELIKG